MLTYLSIINPFSNVFCLSAQDALNLEQKLNTSIKSHEWITIGDILFQFGTASLKDERVYVTEEQFTFLFHLNCN